MRPGSPRGASAVPISRFGRGLLIALAACLGAPAAEAADLKQVLSKLERNPGHREVCLASLGPVAVPDRRPLGRCAANLVGVLYLDLLRDRARLDNIRGAIARQRDLLSAVQQGVNSGVLSTGDSLLAEIELKYWQRQETALIASLLHAELFFRAVMESEPSEFVKPRLAPSAWPRDEAVALAALAQQEDIPEKQLPEVQIALQRAWIDYEAARRDYDLLQPMESFARTLAGATRQQYDIGQVSTATLQDRWRDATRLRDALLTAEYRLLAIQFDIMERLGRRAALE
ncbi:hypothetical protein [Pelagibius marinus]|uniref:hypothetical protein n=1 Tax=Pelagibius marinus TaxID=2762760 RepID=UPI001872C2EA|nr:hypothetical protein [Pelagibius marinus]